MNRKELDAFVEHHRLELRGVEAALEAANAIPTAEELRRFAIRLLQVAGVLSLAAGVVFFVAANWQALAIVGRFVLVEALLAASVAVALWKPPPHAVGRYALLLAFIVTGALLALVGQTYQTGADVYELFLTWAVLGSVLAVAGQWSVIWAAWLLVLNVALWLYCGWQPATGLLWVVFRSFDIDLTLLLVGAMAVDLLLWIVCVRLEGTPFARQAPPWLGRLAFALAIGLGTWAGMLGIFAFEGRPYAPLGLLVLAVLLAGAAVYTLYRQRDVFPLAAIAGSAIILTTAAFIRFFEFEEGGLFLIALWLIGTSAVIGNVLMKLVRAWRPAEDDA